MPALQWSRAKANYGAGASSGALGARSLVVADHTQIRRRSTSKLAKKMTFLSQFERDASIRNLVYPGKRRNRSVDVVIRNRRMPLPSIKRTWHS
jgi:hypothetical protein